MILLDRMVELIKRVALGAVEQSKPTDVLFGSIVSQNPLKIKIDQKQIIDKQFLIITSICERLKQGDSVVLIRMQGGQKFVVIEKVVG